VNNGILIIFEQGLGITVFGMAYMFVHDGLVHKRFPVGPIANVPYFRRVAAAHQVIIFFIFICLAKQIREGRCYAFVCLFLFLVE